jgi:predicted phage terminase large subunit-like protein
MSNSNLLPTAEQIRIQARVELAKIDFWCFCLFYDNEFFKKRLFLKEIADGFQKIFNGEIKSMSASLPPRAGKSYLTTLFAAWHLGKRPSESVMRNTCTATLYDKFSYDTRTIVKSDKFRQVFPESKIADTRQNIAGWNMQQSKQVGYFGAGVGGTIIGFGASGLAITDDLYKSLEDALSERTNEGVHRWLESAHNSRMERGCPSIDIGTRWSKRDVIGTKIESGKYDLSIVIPALINEKSFGEDVKTTNEYLKIRQEILPEIWAAEYMQEPAEVQGMLFKKSELKRFSLKELTGAAESSLGYIDVADEGDDFLSFPIAKIYKNKVFITDIVFNRETIDKTVPVCAAAANKHGLNYIRVEKNNQGGGFIRDLRKLFAVEKILPVTNSQNKMTRIWNEYGFIKDYCHFLDENEIVAGSEYDQWMRNLLGYMKDGSSKHDDAADSLAGLTRFIQSFLPHLFTPEK